MAFLKGGIVCSSAGFGNVGPLGGGADCTLFGICCGLGVAPDELGVADGGGGDACWELAAGTKVGGGPTPCGGGGNGGRIPGPGGRNGGAPGGSIPGGGMPGKPGGIGNPGGGGPGGIPGGIPIPGIGGKGGPPGIPGGWKNGGGIPGIPGIGGCPGIIGAGTGAAEYACGGAP